MLEHDLLALFPFLTREQMLLLLNLILSTTIMVGFVFAFVSHLLQLVLKFVEQLALFISNKLFGSSPSGGSLFSLAESLGVLCGFMCAFYLIIFINVHFYRFITGY